MNAKRIVILAAVVAVAHNALRGLAALLGAPYGLLNYLHPFRPHLQGPRLIGAGAVLAVLALTALIAWREWKRPTPPGSMLASALWTMPTGLLAALFAVIVSTSADHSYGWVLFVLVPFFTGFQASLALSRARPIQISDAIAVSALSVLLLGGLLIATAVEGVICLLMAAPLALFLATLGGLLGYWAGRFDKVPANFACLLLAGLAPFGATLEHALAPSAQVFRVTTSIDLAAAPEQVWQTVLQPAHLDPPTHPLLRAGVGYPESSHIEGFGPTATRYCDFSTGKLVEPVLIWDQPRQLRFTVASNPIPMQEWTPYAQLHPPHLDGFLVSRQGEFRLIPLPAGGTRLEATTWYQHHLWPARYWRWWSDYIIHRIHEMVLANIQARTLGWRVGSAPRQAMGLSYRWDRSMTGLRSPPNTSMRGR